MHESRCITWKLELPLVEKKMALQVRKGEKNSAFSLKVLYYQ